MKKLKLYELSEMIKNGCILNKDVVMYGVYDVVWHHEVDILAGCEVEINSEDEYFYYVNSGDYEVRVLRDLDEVAYDIIENEEREI